MGTLLLVGPAQDAQLAALAGRAGALGLDVRRIHADGAEPTPLSVGTRVLRAAGVELRRDNVVYHHRVAYEFPVVPRPATFDPALLQDAHIALQQRLSLLWSFLDAAEAELDGGRVIEAWSRLNAIAGAYDALERARRAGVPTVRALLTSSLARLRAWNPGRTVRWSYPAEGVPLRTHPRGRWPELLRGGMPLLFLEPEPGDEVRVWFDGERPVLAARVVAPSYANEMSALERFEYLPPPEWCRAWGPRLHEAFGLRFLEVHARERGGAGRLEAVRPDPDVMQLPAGARSFLLDTLLARCAALLGRPVAPPAPPAGAEERPTVFHSRLLYEPLARLGS
jgi:hypothetical protein